MPQCLLYCFVSACTANTNNNQSNENQTPQMLEVEILVPENISLNEETLLKVQVTQGKEYVEDAKEGKFEFWKESDKK